MLHLTHETWYMTRDMRHMIYGGGWKFSQKSGSSALMVWERHCLQDSDQKVDWINKSMNEWIDYEGGNRTAPGTPGRLKGLYFKRKI